METIREAGVQGRRIRSSPGEALLQVQEHWCPFIYAHGNGARYCLEKLCLFNFCISECCLNLYMLLFKGGSENNGIFKKKRDTNSKAQKDIPCVEIYKS